MRLSISLMGGVLIAAWIGQGRGSSAHESLSNSGAARRPAMYQWELQGAGSCASMACHNADALTGYTGREYKLALERDFSGDRPAVKDKHAQAYAVLFGDRSQTIVRNWKHAAPGTAVHAERETLCLRCHVHPAIEAQRARRLDGVAQFRLEDGVSCEACHGPAERWLAVHFLPEFKPLGNEARQAYGMSDTRSVAGRVQVCVGCHVGTPDAEVNHDLIAAGHPRLNFEFSDFQYKLHKHWDEAKDKDPARDPRGRRDFEARSWAIGQIAAAEAALRLLAERAGDERRPWIELAEYNCFACHHDLQPESSQQKSRVKGTAGMLTWSPWYFTLLPEAVEALGSSDAKLAALIRALTAEMEAPQCNRDKTAKLARQSAELLAALGRREPAAALRLPVESLLQKALVNADAKAASSWDHARPRYAALAALARAHRDLGRPAPRLRELEELLRFPLGLDSPRDYDPARIEEALRRLKLPQK